MADGSGATPGAEPLVIRVESSGPDTVVTVVGELDLATAPRLAAVLEEVVAGRPQRLVVECADLAFLDAAGLSVLLAARRSLEPTGGTVVLRSPTPLVLRLLGLLDLRRALPIER